VNSFKALDDAKKSIYKIQSLSNKLNTLITESIEIKLGADENAGMLN